MRLFNGSPELRQIVKTKMLSINEAVKILNNNSENRKYTKEESKQILGLLYQFGEIAYLQFKTIKDEKSNIVRTSVN